MKKRLTLSALFMLFLFIGSKSYAQMVGDCVFLQGHYVEIGVAPNGGYGSTLPAPAGYHPFLGGTTFNFWDPAAASATSSGNFIGFVADYGRDGWTVGTPPFFGDFYLPGDPQEGWAIQQGATHAQATAYIPSYQYTSGPALTGYTGGLSGTNTAFVHLPGGIMKGIWNGRDGALAIRQTTILDTTKLYFTVNVVITNTGSVPVTDIYYIRTVDPDNDETRNPGDYTTVNTITYQLPNPTNRVLVSTTGNDDHRAYLGLGTKDCRAKCMIFDGGLAPEYSLDSMWDGLTTYIYTQGTGSTADVGIALDYNIGTLAAGDSTSLTYAYILNAAYIDSALDATQPAYYVNDTLNDSAINLCFYTGDSIIINITNGGFYHWSWAPDSFLASPATEGPFNVIHSDSITSNIVYTITGTNAAGGCDSIVYHLTLSHNGYPKPVLSPAVSYCQDATWALPLTAVGSNVLWYTSATGGSGTPVAPTPSTTIPGTFIFYADQSNGLCRSPRAADTVTIIPLPAPPFISDPTPYCQAQPFVPFTITGLGVLWYTALTGGVGSATAPTVNTNIPGTDTVFASQTVAGCEGPRQTYVVTVLDSIIPSFTYAIHFGCKGDTVDFTNGSIDATQYEWTFGDGYSDTATNPAHIYHSQDVFTVTVTAKNAQCFDSAAQVVTLIHPLHAAFTADPMIVCQESPVSFTNSSVGTGLSYVWHFGNGGTSINANPSYTYNNTGAYKVQLVATDFVPCKDTAYATIQVDSISAISLSLTDSVLCRSTYSTFTANYTSIGNTGITWNFGDGDSILNLNPVAHSFDATGNFTVTATAHFRACRDTAISKQVTIYPQPSIELGSDLSICPGSESLVLADNNNINIAHTSWLWSTGATTPAITIVEPGVYSVIVNIDGCRATDTVTVKNDCYMNIPNVFTPNNDGLNDYFFPRQYLTSGLTSFSMSIYNRWGQLVFSSTTLDGRGWDGKFNGVDQIEGVYVYIIDATFRDGQKEHHQGNVTLLR